VESEAFYQKIELLITFVSLNKHTHNCSSERTNKTH